VRDNGPFIFLVCVCCIAIVGFIAVGTAFKAW
jgi:hypothetical protein